MLLIVNLCAKLIRAASLPAKTDCGILFEVGINTERLYEIALGTRDAQRNSASLNQTEMVHAIARTSKLYPKMAASESHAITHARDSQVGAVCERIGL